MCGCITRLLLPSTAAALLMLPACARGAALSVRQLAARVDQHYNRLNSLEAAFVQTYTGMGMHKREAGALLLKKPGQMRWTYTQPDGKLYVLDGKYGYFYTPGQTEAQKVPARKLDDLQSPLRYLLGHTRLMREIPNLHIVSEANGEYTLQGVPRGMQKSISSVTLKVTAAGYIRAIRVAQTDGIVNELDFSGETDNVPAPASAFAFHAPAGVYVVNSMTPME